MKFLIDNMLSPELARMLRNDYPGTGHVQEELYPKAKDTTIWQYAAENGFTILSKDGEFVKLLADRGHPPKVVRLRIGNCTTEETAEAIRNNAERIRQLDNDEDEGFLEVYRRR